MNYGRDVIPRTVEELAVGIRFTITTYPDNVYEITAIKETDSIWDPMSVTYKQVMANGMLRSLEQHSTTFLNNSRVRLI